ncbi:glycine betaine/L-proline ABC transporter ATP-binding protein [Jonesiaceae bacterium BS-20]|uniref:Glycine betaine/L-proline ABC transporter ATP-binding protein n=1 Tax=Jonesiaceae bacterium BS-20 TaxID=3120821 RepID=A0AAU7DWQ0_9MICO
METNTVLRVNGAYKIFGRRAKEALRRLEQGATKADVAKQATAAVIDASFEVTEGEIFVVMGLSGSGKSTLIRMLNGLLTPNAGAVEIHGKDITKVSPSELRDIRQKNISMVFQHFALLPHKTVLENAAYGLEIQGIDKAARHETAMKIIKLVGLGGFENSLPSELSGGMQQRVGLARALTADTDILLMDEAFSALDPLIRREMQEQLVELQATLNKTIIFITHDLNEAMFLGDRIAVMRDGRIVQVGTPEEILTDPANDYVAQFVQDVDRARVLTAASVMEKSHLEVAVTSGPRAALLGLRKAQASSVFVVGRGRQFLGVARDRDVLALIKEDKRDLTPIIKETITVLEDTPLADLIEPSLASGLPLAVVSESGRLLGTIPRVTLLAALSHVNTNTGEIPIVSAPTPVSEELVEEVLTEAGLTADYNGEGEIK